MPSTTNLTSIAASVAAAVASHTPVAAPATPPALLVLEAEAKLLRDLRALKGRDERTRKHLKAQVFAAIKARLGIPSDAKIKFEADDTTNDDYLKVKNPDGSLYGVTADVVAPRQWYLTDASPQAAVGAISRWYCLVGSADADVWAVPAPTTDTVDAPVDQRVAVINGKVYVSLTSDEAADF